MATSAEIEPKRCLLLLKEIRSLYAEYLKFFLPDPAPSEKFAQTLSSLKDGIYRFDSKYNTGKESLLAFHQLTIGLSDTLIALRDDLRSCARHYGLDALDGNDWPFDFDAASVEQLQARLDPICMGVDITNEAMEIALHGYLGTRSSETVKEIYKRIDEAENSSARLQTLVHNFVEGITVEMKLETTDGRDLHTFTSANIAHHEVGQNIAAKLKQMTQEAVSTKREDEGRFVWMIRHSIYWLSKSSEDLREWKSEHGGFFSNHTLHPSHEAWHMIPKIFLDAIKAAWLLGDIGDLEEPSLGIQQVVICIKTRVLGLLQEFYRDLFTVPNYDLIYELGDFAICMHDERE